MHRNREKNQPRFKPRKENKNIKIPAKITIYRLQILKLAPENSSLSHSKNQYKLQKQIIILSNFEKRTMKKWKSRKVKKLSKKRHKISAQHRDAPSMLAEPSHNGCSRKIKKAKLKAPTLASISDILHYTVSFSFSPISSDPSNKIHPNINMTNSSKTLAPKSHHYRPKITSITASPWSLSLTTRS